MTCPRNVLPGVAKLLCAPLVPVSGALTLFLGGWNLQSARPFLEPDLVVQLDLWEKGNASCFQVAMTLKVRERAFLCDKADVGVQ